MSNFKSIVGFQTKKHFFQAVGFYFIYLVFGFIIAFMVLALMFFMLPLNDFNDADFDMIVKIVSSVYILILSLFVIKGRKLTGYIGYFSLMLLGGLVGYLINPMLGLIMPAYLTTRGQGPTESKTTII